MKRISYAKAAALLRYEPDTGKLYWRTGSPWRKKGARAGTISIRPGNYRYVVVDIDGGSFHGHRIAWLLMTGHWPKGIIRFRDKDGANCRWRNLVPASSGDLKIYARTQSNNTSGHRGVCFHTSRKKWIARIDINRQRIWGGYHVTKAAAIKARRALAKQYSYPL